MHMHNFLNRCMLGSVQSTVTAVKTKTNKNLKKTITIVFDGGDI